MKLADDRFKKAPNTVVDSLLLDVVGAKVLKQFKKASGNINGSHIYGRMSQDASHMAGRNID